LGYDDSDDGNVTVASIFGVSTSLSFFPKGCLSYWQLDAFGDGNDLRANAFMAAAIAGAGTTQCDSAACDWYIAGFGNDNWLSARAKVTENGTIFGNSYGAVLFGVAHGSDSPNSFCNWRIGPATNAAHLAFGGGNTLLAEAETVISYGAPLLHANLFGAGYLLESNNSFCHWSIGSFGQDSANVGNSLIAKAFGKHITSACSTMANIFGAAHIHASQNAFLDWSIGNFFDGQTLLAQANSTAISSGYAWTNLFGVGTVTNSDNSFCNWSIGNFGQDSVGAGNILTSTAFGTCYGWPKIGANC
jgi:hypothetical protein